MKPNPISLNINILLVAGFAISAIGAPIRKELSSRFPVSVTQDYPRMVMRREDWLSLNGTWESGFTFWKETNAGTFSKKTRVPFPRESTLARDSERPFNELQRLWYRHRFRVPSEWTGKRILLHFEAVDWETKVWVNGRQLGEHHGAYDHFSFDITELLKSEGNQELIVSVWDPTESGYQPRGKQMKYPSEPFLHASSGIWQTVWLEPVPEISIDSLKLVPDIDLSVLKMTVAARGSTNGITVEAIASDGRQFVARGTGAIGEEFQLAIPRAKLWSPTSPFLYDLTVRFIREGKKVDEVSSYFGMRKISIGKDEKGFQRLMLNNQAVFQLGPLDQGYWPEGIYTAPSDEALRYDIEVMKKLGFNICRKHVKIEPDRWYYWCDKLGLLVWQDMPNGDKDGSARREEIRRTPESARQFETELEQMIVQRGNHPCIVIWAAFNQGWGQYDTVRITELIKRWDPSRLVISASGWHDKGVGDVRSIHNYTGKLTAEQDGKRACVLGECGALGLVIPNHLWGNVGRWNVSFFQTPEGLTEGYRVLISRIKVLKQEKGLSGAVITQLTDTETELDGFMTYDRALIKMPVETVREINEELISGSRVVGN